MNRIKLQVTTEKEFTPQLLQVARLDHGRAALPLNLAHICLCPRILGDADWLDL